MPSERAEQSETTRRRLLCGGGAAALLALAGCASQTEDGKTDDWQYSPVRAGDGVARSGGGGAQAAQAQSTNAGYATGGAKDVNNFRQNLAEGYLPLPTDVSYEGLFYDYYFETGSAGACSRLFCPTYATATTADPLSGATERYLTVGLNSNRAPGEFERPPLNLVVVLDTSGSMSSGFGEYYYDRAGRRQAVERPNQPKIRVATEAIADLTRQLRPEDRLGIVTYSSGSQVAKPLRAVEATDMEAIRGHLPEVEAGGGTDLGAGLSDAVDLLSEYGSNPRERETRMVVLTDAMPNLGTTSEGGLRGRLRRQAAEHRHVTFVGVGVDFNTEIVDAITEVRGANYYAVRSPEQFRTRLGEEFAYMVTPMVFDLSVEVEGPLELQRVYGTTAAEEATGRVLSAKTLFPAPSEDGRTRGGVILAKVRRTGSGTVRLRAAWEDRAGSPGSTSTRVEFPAVEPEHFANPGVRKAVLLARYADLLKSWAIDERERDGQPRTDGVRVPEPTGRWERESTPLRVSPEYRERFAAFAEHFRAAVTALGDDRLGREIDVLERLATHDTTGRPHAPGVAD
jgi:Ca-activated chloride channel family protein